MPSIDLSDALVHRLTEAGMLSPEAIDRLINSALDRLETTPPLINAYQTLFDQTHDAVFIIAPDGRNMAVNKRACEMTGFTAEEYTQLSFRETSADPLGSDVTMKQLLSGEIIPPYERPFRTKGGGSFMAEVTAELVRDAAGNPLYIQSVVRDITQRKRDDARLRDSERLLRQIIDLAPLQIFVKDAKGQYLLANNTTAEDFGVTVDAMIGKTDRDLCANPAEAVRFQKQDKQVLKKNQLVMIQNDEFTDAEGRKRILHTVKMPLMFPGRDEPVVLGVSTDITEITEAANALQKAYQQEYELAAERQRVQILTQFIQDSSHEFRTPLSVISTSLHLMARTDSAEKRAAHATQAATQIKRITRLVEQLQVMIDVDGVTTFGMTRVDMNHIIRVAVGRLPKASDRPHPNISLALDNTLPDIEGDGTRLGQALEHLLDNAIRFTPTSGTVTISTRREDTMISIEVADTGIGIAPQDLPNVTQRFWRRDSSHTTPGFGLGLPIAQKIVERHNGTLTIASSPQAGTIVTVTLPMPT